VPGAHDLADLADEIGWARDHDAQARAIAEEGRRFAHAHLGRTEAFLPNPEPSGFREASGARQRNGSSMSMR